MKKMYSAFLSSVYTSLLDERAIVIDTMLNYNVFPICMEHFTVSDNRRFDDISDYIINSDFFILMLGNEYGSTDSDGISWTQKEYVFAKAAGIDILALKMPDWWRIKQIYDTDKSNLTPDQIKQVEFGLEIMAEKPDSNEELREILSIYFHDRISNHENAYVGWVRDRQFNKNEEIWQRKHSFLHLEGQFFHVHILPSNSSYLRSGYIEIKQTFNSKQYHNLKVTGYNYPTKFDKETMQLKHKKLNCTEWEAEYRLNEDGTIKNGVYSAAKRDTDEFGGKIVRPGVRRGLHDFVVYEKRECGLVMRGTFHDEVQDDVDNGGKAGIILVFASAEDCIRFMTEDEELCEILLNNQSKKLI